MADEPKHKPKYKPFPKGADFDPDKIKPDLSLSRDITDEVVAQRGGVQIIGGVRPPPAKPPEQSGQENPSGSAP